MSLPQQIRFIHEEYHHKPKRKETRIDTDPSPLARTEDHNYSHFYQIKSQRIDGALESHPEDPPMSNHNPRLTLPRKYEYPYVKRIKFQHWTPSPKTKSAINWAVILTPEDFENYVFGDERQNALTDTDQTISSKAVDCIEGQAQSDLREALETDGRSSRAAQASSGRPVLERQYDNRFVGTEPSETHRACSGQDNRSIAATRTEIYFFNCSWPGCGRLFKNMRTLYKHKTAEGHSWHLQEPIRQFYEGIKDPREIYLPRN